MPRTCDRFATAEGEARHETGLMHARKVVVKDIFGFAGRHCLFCQKTGTFPYRGDTVSQTVFLTASAASPKLLLEHCGLGPPIRSVTSENSRNDQDA